MTDPLLTLEASLRALVEEMRKHATWQKGLRDAGAPLYTLRWSETITAALDAALLGDASRPPEAEKHEAAGSTAERRTGAVIAAERTEVVCEWFSAKRAIQAGISAAHSEAARCERAARNTSDGLLLLSAEGWRVSAAVMEAFIRQYESRSPDGDGLPIVKGLEDERAATSSARDEQVATVGTPQQARVHARENTERNDAASLKPAAGSEPADSLSPLATGDASRPPQEPTERPERSKRTVISQPGAALHVETFDVPDDLRREIAAALERGRRDVPQHRGTFVRRICDWFKRLYRTAPPAPQP